MNLIITQFQLETVFIKGFKDGTSKTYVIYNYLKKTHYST